MCSLRSWPVQNALPVPVSTTQRTAVSSATCCTVSSSSSLVAMLRLLYASGRFSVIVATPSVTSSSTGESVMRGHLVRPGRPVRQPRQRATKRSAPGLSRVASVANSAAASRPGQSSGSSASGRPGSANRNFRHSWTRWNRAANAASSASSCAVEVLRDEVVGGVQPAVVRRAQPRRGPRRRSARGRTRSARAVRAVAPARSRIEVELGARERADPHVVASSAYPTNVRSARSRARAARSPAGRRTPRCQWPSQAGSVAPVDPVGGLVEAAVGPLGGAVAAAAAAAGPAPASPASPSARSRSGRPARRCRPGRACGPRPPPAPGCRGRAGGRRTRRRGPSGPAWAESASRSRPALCRAVTAPIGDNGSARTAQRAAQAVRPDRTKEEVRGWRR